MDYNQSTQQSQQAKSRSVWMSVLVGVFGISADVKVEKDANVQVCKLTQL